MESLRTVESVIGSPIDVIDWDCAVNRIVKWGEAKESKVVCICNSHSVVTARFDSEFKRVVRDADMATPDGAPVAALISILRGASQERINGPDLMLKVCREAELKGVSVYFYGGSEVSLNLLLNVFERSFPKLAVAGYYSPPFRPLSEEEDAKVVDSINKSGAGLVWVGLGCPKQEIWMSAHKNRIQAVMLGVGAAFDYHSGVIKRAPLWMRKFGLEWFHRLCSEPRRLWRRYLYTNSAFVFFSLVQIFNRLVGRKV